MVKIGETAPDFTAPALLGSGELSEAFHFRRYIDNHITVLFFYPLDFTFVCPSELLAFQQHLPKFTALGSKVVGVSIDSQYTHLAWRNTPVSQGGIGVLDYPLVADIKHDICQRYGVESPEQGVALRASFLIDQEGKVRHYVVNDLPLGRNVEEMLRMIAALKFYQAHGQVCPAQWQPGAPGMDPSPEGVKAYLANYSDRR